MVWEGVFQAVGDVFEILKISDVSKNHLIQFTQQAELLASRQIEFKTFEENSQAIDPRLGQAAKEIKESGKYAFGISLIIILFLQSCDFNIDAKLDVNPLLSGQKANNSNWLVICEVKHLDSLTARA